jgi:wyosine [tRNA(Phe)-imidazoG37] synthetase (radical SAM superfamily)
MRSFDSLAPLDRRRYYRRMHDPGDHTRDREAGRLVYPVISRRSGGLSLGINLFPEAKVCTFDCPYCEVFVSSGQDGGFSIADLEEELENFLDRVYPESWAPEPVRDLCISGNGEPTLSLRLGEVLELCARVRRAHVKTLGSASLVLITNSIGFLDPAVSALLERFSRDEDLVLLAKLDAGGEDLFHLMSGANVPLDRVAGGLLSFARRRPIVIQTMLCEVEGRSPSDKDLADYAALLSRLVAGGARVDEVHLYTFARPSPGDHCAALSDETLRRHAAFVRGATGLPVRVFGIRAELRLNPEGIERW